MSRPTPPESVVLVGGFAEMIELVESLGTHIVGVVDAQPVGATVHHHTVAGDDDWFLAQPDVFGTRNVVLSPDLPAVRRRIFDAYRAAGCAFPPMLAGSVSAYASVGEGCVAQVQTHVSADCTIEDNVRINVGATVMHDCRVGHSTTIAPGAMLLGRVTVGEGVYIGSRATLLPDVSVGPDAVIGAGAVVTRDVAAGATVKGVPAR